VIWGDEIDRIVDEADGDLGILVGLVALRKTENGGPGREYGVLSLPAPTYEKQLEIAGNSLRNSEMRARKAGLRTRDALGFYTEDFLLFFSARWAPVNGATNDPHGLNRHHAANLALHARLYAAGVVKSLRDVLV